MRPLENKAGIILSWYDVAPALSSKGFCIMEKTNGSIVSNTGFGDKEEFLFTYSEEEKQQNEINKSNASFIWNVEYIRIFPELLGILTPTEAMIFGFIHFYKAGDSQRRFYFTNKQLSDLICCSEDTVSRCISKLESVGLIETSLKRKASGGTIRFVNKVSQKLPTDKNASSNMGKCLPANRQNLQAIKNKNIENNINKNKKEKYTDFIQKSDVLPSFGLSMDYIEKNFEHKKTLDTILNMCARIRKISIDLCVQPVYNKDTINATHILRKNYHLNDYEEFLEKMRDNWINGNEETYTDIIRSDYYLPVMYDDL